MAAAVPCTLHKFRLILVSLGLGTIFVILVFYGATSGAPYRHQLSFDVIRGYGMIHKSIGGTRKPVNNATNLFSSKVEIFANVTTASEKPIPQKNTAEPHVIDLKTIDMSEEFECDKQCQGKIQQMRQRGVANACAVASKIRRRPRIWDSEGNLRADQMMRLNHLFPIKKTKTIYCSVPKDGCSAWKRKLLQVAGFNPEKYPSNIHPYFHSKFKALSTYNTTEAGEILKTYKKFLFVREPFQRMLSLFVDKALSKHDLPFNDTQFEQFLKFILKRPVTGRAVGYSEHWTHAAILCLPCDISYSFIGRLETSKRDYDYILDNLFHVENKLINKRKNVHSSHSSDTRVKEHYIKQVNVSMLRKIYKKYQLDYTIFTYSQPNIMKTKTHTNRLPI